MSGNILQTAGQIAYQLSFQLSPIIFVNGIASGLGGLLPIIAITETGNLIGNLLGGSINTSLDGFFASYRPMPGTSIYEAEFSKRPFASMAVAADAVITQPLRLSMHMMCPVKSPGGYTAKLGILTALKLLIDQHTSQGGYFAVATPSYIFSAMLLESIVDASGDDIQAQIQWQWNFIAPQLTLQQAAAAQSSQMSKITQGLPGGGSLSGIAQGVGSPSSLISPNLISPVANTAGMNLSGDPSFSTIPSSPLPPP